MRLGPLRVYYNYSIYLTYVNDSIHLTYAIFHSQGLVFHGHCRTIDNVHDMSSLICFLMKQQRLKKSSTVNFRGFFEG